MAMIRTTASRPAIATTTANPSQPKQGQPNYGYTDLNDKDLDKAFNDARQREFASNMGGMGQGFVSQSQLITYEQNRRKREQEDKFNLDKLSPIPAPKRDPRVIALMNSQRDLAKRFRAGMGENIESEYGEFQRDRSRELAGEREAIDGSFNRRGLLRSGMREGASVDAGAQATKDLYSKRLEIGDRYRETADQLDDEPLQTEIALAGGAGNVGQTANAANQEFQKLVLENRQNRQNALESAFGAGGYFLGAAAAGGGAKSPYASPGAWSPGAVENSGAYNPFMDYYMGAQ
jgi:hypothetical protein